LTILYTRKAVASAADTLGKPALAALYFEGNQGAFDEIHAVLKDATWEKPE